MAQEKDKTLFPHPPAPQAPPVPVQETIKTRDHRNRPMVDSDWIDKFEEAVERGETLELEFLAHLEEDLEDHYRYQRRQRKENDDE